MSSSGPEDGYDNLRYVEILYQILNTSKKTGPGHAERCKLTMIRPKNTSI